jgi:hypothetical protein
MIWNVGQNPLDAHNWYRFAERASEPTGMLNHSDYANLDYELAKKYGMLACSRVRLPADRPQFIVSFPLSNYSFLPDFFSGPLETYCSARLRNAMALPPDSVDYVPIVVQSQDPAVHRQDYQIMRVLAEQPAIDLERSNVEMVEHTDPHIGGVYTEIDFALSIVLVDGFQAKSDLFRPAEWPFSVFATDALAERVMKAGCTGIEFGDLATLTGDKQIIRTSRGIEEYGPKARRHHLRVVARRDNS